MDEGRATRSVKISDDERGGWSSDRPRSGKGPQRPANISTRCTVLPPTDRMRYSPGSLVLVSSASAEVRDKFVERLITDKSAVLSPSKVRGIIKGRVPDEELDAKAAELQLAAMQKRFGVSDTVVIGTDGLDVGERERYVRPAAAARRPRHIILLETSKDQVDDEQAKTLNELRTRLDAGALGEEGIQTAMRLTVATASELKRIIFAPPPRDED